ncbi:hypothetical protein ACFYM0_23695 [Streptomyces sp. NPDC006487]|uniref:hypothetical protein n=1 Tax=Streptomyces sp. NPDC006487 TaxID=3364748 RepID=UPI0036AAC3ED
MTTEPPPEAPDREAERRRAGIAAFLAATAGSFAFFAFFPGLPHVIDWGAIIASLAVGGLARWAWLKRLTQKHPSLK